MSLRALLPVAVLAAAAGAWGGHEWAARSHRAEAAQAAAYAAEQLAAERRRADAARAQHAAERAEFTRRLAETRGALSHALRTPLDCPPGAVLADVLVPADAVGRLRDAGADPAP